MDGRALSASQSHRLFGLVVDRLAESEIPFPQAGEREPEFTGRSVFPAIKALVCSLDYPGLFVSGDGGPGARPSAFLGLNYTPDVTITYFEQRLLAVEVKILRSASKQASIATGIGQSAIYKAGGYERSLAVLFDEAPGWTARPRLPNTAAIDGILVFRQSSSCWRFAQ